MVEPALSDTWKRWRGERQRELLDGGLPRRLAYRFATGESLARQRAEFLIGREAAKSATLLCIEREGGLTFALKLPAFAT